MLKNNNLLRCKETLEVDDKIMETFCSKMADEHNC